MTVRWTADQKQAIEMTGCNLLVSAAAGSGKTAVLVERILRMIERGVDVDRLLVTTFTNAAAAKMRLQIGEALQALLAKRPQDQHLKRQLTLLNRASICTVHSFCLDIVRTNFHLLKIDPDFSVADANEMELLKDQIAQEVFEQLYEEGDEAFLDLADTYGGQRGDEKLQELMLRTHEFIRAMPFPEAWLSQKADMFQMDQDFDSLDWIRTIKQSAHLTVDGCLAMAQEMRSLVLAHPEIAGYSAAVESDICALQALKGSLNGTWDGIVDALAQFTFEALKAARGVDPALTEPVKELRGAIKLEMKALREKVFCTHAAELKSDLQRLGPRMRALGMLVCRFDERFAEAKRQRGVLDFGDLEHQCLRALSQMQEDGQAVPSQVALALRERYEEILIDEYQDSNELQETIFSMISRGNNLFMVGDMKQSIYRFRHTNPMLFRYKQDTYSRVEGRDRKVVMSQNFRSRSQIIDGVNFIFRQIASPLVGEMQYGTEERLHAGLCFPAPEKPVSHGGKIEVLVATPESSETEKELQEEESESLTGIEAEALAIARRIDQLIAEPYYVCEGGQYRRVTYRDIVILMRATAGTADIFTQVLQSFGIPVFADTGGGYFMTEEVVTMLSLLEVIDNPMQDIPLLSVLRSPIAAFDDNDLLQMRLCGEAGDIFTALRAGAQTEGPVADKCRKFLESLEQWRSLAEYLPTHELIWKLYSDTGYYSFVGAMAGGEQRQANLRLLYERARQYERTSFRGLFHFIGFIGRMRRASGDMGSAKLLGENQDVVRIMSIHKSKGLEFPVVFVAGLGKRFNIRDMTQNVLLHKDLGFGPDYRDNEACFTYPSVAKIAIRQKMKYENLSEEMRLLYVALTRAKEKLILSMHVRDWEKSKDRWGKTARAAGQEQLPLHSTAGAQCFADWVMPCVLRCSGCEAEAVIPLELPAEFEVRLCCGGAFAAQQRPDSLPECHPSANRELVQERLNYRYLYASAAKIPTKISVTELKRIHNFEIDADAAALYEPPMLDTPAFLREERGLSAAQRGSVMHFVMQHLDLDAPLDPQGVQLQVQTMRRLKLLDDRQARAVSAAQIAAFFQTELGKRLLKSGRVVRETPFEIGIDSGEVYGAEYGGETMLLQGIVDCFFEENGNLILVDYKTDLVHNKMGEANRLAKKYWPQLKFYARALEQITGKRVTEKNLYFFSSNCVVKCD